MKKPLILMVALLFIGSLQSQTYFDHGNEWLTASTTGLARITVDHDGVYRITAAQLSSGGISLAGVPLSELHLYHLGQEVPMRVEDSGGSLIALEFYGQIADGGDEQNMYRDPFLEGVVDPSKHFNPNRSIYSDVSTYFLVSQPSSGLRITEYADTSYASHTAEASVRTTVRKDFLSGQWQNGPGTTFDSYFQHNPDFVMGEGCKGEQFSEGSDFSHTLLTPGAHPSGGPSSITVRVLSLINGSHKLNVEVEGLLCIDTIFSGFALHDYQASLAGPPDDSTLVTLQSFSPSTPGDLHTAQFMALEYDHGTDLAGASSFTAFPFDKMADTYLQLTSLDATSSVWLWDLTTGTRCAGTFSAGTFQVIVPGNPLVRDLRIVSDKAVQNVLGLLPWSVPGLSSTSMGAEMVVIPAPNLEASANEYMTYRSTASPFPLSTVVVPLQDIYDEFGYGQITPLAIKRFTHYAKEHWAVTPRFVMLWGKGTQGARGAISQGVPAYSWPASDKEYVSNFRTDSLDLFSWAAIGRVPAENNAEGMTYLSKLMAFENATCSAPFEGVFLSGGNEAAEINIFASMVSSLADSFATSPYGGIPYVYQNDTIGGVVTTAPFSSDSAISRGPAIIQFLGHGNGETIDVDFGEPDDHSASARLPFIYNLGANGSRFDDSLSYRSERWLMHPDKGCIAFLGYSTYLVYASPSYFYATQFDHRLFRTYLNRPIGNAVLSADSAATTVMAIQPRSLVLLGDPSLILCNPTASTGKPQLGALLLYPNPATESVTVSMNQLAAGEVDIELLSLQGALIRREEHKYSGGNAEWTLPLQTVANGMYLVRVSRNGELLSTGKVAVQK